MLHQQTQTNWKTKQRCTNSKYGTKKEVTSLFLWFDFMFAGMKWTEHDWQQQNVAQFKDWCELAVSQLLPQPGPKFTICCQSKHGTLYADDVILQAFKFIHQVWQGKNVKKLDQLQEALLHLAVRKQYNMRTRIRKKKKHKGLCCTSLHMAVESYYKAITMNTSIGLSLLRTDVTSEWR